MITVLVATYNGSEFIIKQLQSIMMQTLKPDRVIICDDCSTDDSVSVIKDFIEVNNLKNSWTLYQNQENLGHYKTFIKLCSLAETEYIFFSDQDDIWHNDKLKVMLPELVKDNVSMVSCKSDFIDQNDNIISTPIVSNASKKVGTHLMFTKWPSGYQMGLKHDLIRFVLENHFEKLPGFDYHDVLFGMISALFGEVVLIDKILDSHRIHLNNVTRSVSTKSFNSSLEERILYQKKVLLRYKSLQFINEKNISEGNVNEEIIESYIQQTSRRISFLKRFSIRDLKKLLKNKDLYCGSKDLISDTIYSLRLNKVASMIIRISGDK